MAIQRDLTQLMYYDYRVLVGTEWPVWRILCELKFKSSTNAPECATTDEHGNWLDAADGKDMMVAGYPTSFIQQNFATFIQY